jgi:hypothetical protein
MAEIKGGDRLEAFLKGMASKVTNASTLRVGILEGATEADGTPSAMVAFWAEFGTRTAPPRPFFRTMIAKHGDEWPGQISALLANNGMDAKNALEVMGQVIAGELRQSIIDVVAPPLSPITLMLRKMVGNHPELITGAMVGEAARRVAAGEDYGGVSDKPLIWSGDMIGSVDSEVT